MPATATAIEPGRELPAGPRVSETYWGYVIHDHSDPTGRASLISAALRFSGLVLVLSAYGQWFLPAALYTGDVLVSKAGLSFLLGAVGVTLYWVARRGGDLDMHVDLSRRELRLVRRTGRGSSHTKTVVPMSRVESAFIARPQGGAQPSQLFLRIRDRDDVMHVARGDESDLRALHGRLSHDLRPVEERINHRLARALPFKSRRAV